MQQSVLKGSIRSWIQVTAVGAALLVLAACGAAPPAERGEAHGSWEGTWTSTLLREGGDVNAQFIHSGVTLTGSVSITGSPCLVTGTVDGTVDGADVAFGAVSGSHGIRFTAQLGQDTMSGTYSVSAGACAGDSGTFELSRLN